MSPVRSIRTEQNLTATAVIVAALTVAGAASLLNDIRLIRSGRIEQLRATLNVLGENATAAIEFNEPKTAQDLLRSLKQIPYVRAACIFGADGSQFASYHRELDEEAAKPAAPPPLGIHTPEFAVIEVASAIENNGERVGTIWLRAELSDLAREIAKNTLLPVASMLISLAGALVLSRPLQRRLIAPIQRLARLMEQVGRENNYMLRVEVEGPHEVRVLCDGFNAMLEQVEYSRKGLEDAHDRLEQRVAERTVELSAANEELQRAMHAAEAANLAKTEFLANMSHEIRTPMTAILGYTEVLQDYVKEPEAVDAAKTLRRNGEHLLEIINDILDLSKIEAGQFDIEQAWFSPLQLASDVANLMKVRADAKGLDLTVVCDTPVPQQIRSDSTRLRQILINLVGNAIKFTERGYVSIAVGLDASSQADSHIVFNVHDTGIGVSEEQMGRLFKPFSQADTSMSRKFGGTGLGLSISKRLAERLGGELTVTSVFGRGSTFKVTVTTGPLDGIPLISPERLTQLVPTNAPPKPSPAATCLAARILLAEDGPDNQRLISLVLQKAGADVTVVENGRLARDVALSADLGRDSNSPEKMRPFDIILMDMQMPVMDGYEATRELRANGYKGPVIALTAHAMNHDRQKCLDAGCDDYLTKPIDRQRLVQTIAGYLNASKGPSPDERPSSDAAAFAASI